MTTSGRRHSPCRPASYEYKAALNDSWDENYGPHAELNSLNNVPLALASAGSVKFYYDHKSHWVTDNRGSVIAVAAGSFQSELGCGGDWDPSCLRSWLQDIDGDGTYSFETTALPQGSYETKVAINEGWDENYGPNGELNSPNNIGFAVPADNAKVTMDYDSVTHVLSITVAADHGAPGGPGALSHFDLARKDCLGTARNRTSKVWYTVAGGMLSDVYYPTVDNTNVETLQYIVSDGSTFTDLQARDMTYTVAAIADTGGMACRVTASANRGTYQIVTDYITDPARNTLLMRVTFVPESSGLQLYVRFDPTVNGNGGGGPGNGGADSATVAGSPDHPILVASDPVTATNAANRDYAQPVFAALDGTSRRRRPASPAPRATGSCSSTRRTASRPRSPTHGTGTSWRPPGSPSTTRAAPSSRSGSVPRRTRPSARRKARSARASTRRWLPTRRAGRPTTPA